MNDSGNTTGATMLCPICHTVLHAGVTECPACGEWYQPATETDTVVNDAASPAAFAELVDAEFGTSIVSRKHAVRIELDHLPRYLQRGEAVLHMAVARYGGRKGLLALTDQRLLFISVEFAGLRVEEFQFAKIDGIWAEQHGRGRKLMFTAFGNRAEITHIHQPDRSDLIASYIRDRNVPPVEITDLTTAGVTV